MATIFTNSRAFRVARLFVFSCCALATAGTSVSFAQTFREPSLMSVLADAEESSKSTKKNARPVFTASQIVSEQPASASNKIVSVSAELPSSKPKATVKRPATIAKSKAKIRQTQYAEAAQNDQYANSLGVQQGLGVGIANLNEEFVDKCPDPKDMPNILDIPYKVVPTPGAFPESCPLPDEDFQRKAPTPITFTWKASSLCYKPLYFEDVQLERYGHYCHPLVQPVWSRVKFWLTIPCLPYLMGVNPPNECIYDLGYYRPGNCAPSMIEPIPISLRGGLIQAGAVVGGFALIP